MCCCLVTRMAPSSAVNTVHPIGLMWHWLPVLTCPLLQNTHHFTAAQHWPTAALPPAAGFPSQRLESTSTLLCSCFHLSMLMGLTFTRGYYKSSFIQCQFQISNLGYLVCSTLHTFTSTTWISFLFLILSSAWLNSYCLHGSCLPVYKLLTPTPVRLYFVLFMSREQSDRSGILLLAKSKPLAVEQCTFYLWKINKTM